MKRKSPMREAVVSELGFGKAAACTVRWSDSSSLTEKGREVAHSRHAGTEGSQRRTCVQQFSVSECENTHTHTQD